MNIEKIFLAIIDTAIAISAADFGNIQLIDPIIKDLKIVAQRGFPKYWLDYWDNVCKGQGACGNALKYKKRIIVEDVCHSSIFKNEDLAIQLKVGVRAVQSTPLINCSGKIFGMFSTHYKTPHQLDEHSLHLLDLLTRQAVNSIEQIEIQTKLKKAIIIRDDFISMISHEFNNPLASIKLVTQQGKKLMEAGKLTEKKLIKLFGIWTEQYHTFEYLIGDMLDLTAISQNQLKFNCQELDLNELIKKIIKKFDDQVSYKGVSIICHWDPHRIEQIITNLVTNGIKYGNGYPVQIELKKLLKEKRFKLIVKDKGIGIALKDRKKIFNKFERISHPDTLSISGAGLGLYIINQIVISQGGNIQLNSKVGLGSTFTITLPLDCLSKLS